MPHVPEPLRSLQVLDRLLVGPPLVDKRGLCVPYAASRGGVTEETTLSYRYEESVFDPEDPTAQNLASLIGAQLALNYGLFCREVVFRGRFDAVDREFLSEMAANTAREIYVNKILEPNPFLRGEVSDLPAIPLDSYLFADLRFEREGEEAPVAGSWRTRPEGHAILSSGGKDSLLTFGILRELEREVHPIFLNESGRHWYTALNAHRGLERVWPTTSRVWTSSDRVFSWMLRRLPFVREDFARVRSDAYPLRLWTVAVFLFGALPLLRKRRLGRLLIGDEFDTSERAEHEGIPHFNGLYDQSRWFDEACSQFFAGKGWGIHQMSLLRPASELLIQKVVRERYPDLLPLQVSCHATHLEGGRARPCGRCEKCRRIVSMLVALEADPAACGYTEEQVARALGSLVEEGIHQEAAGAEHLLWMLRQAGRLSSAPEAREHPEILALRFDEERSPILLLPDDLRGAVHGILLEHASGAVRWEGESWAAFELPAQKDPPGPRRETGEAQERGEAGDEPVLGRLTWPEAEERLRHTDLALLPVGAIEQHGPHLPLDTDAWDAEYLARRVAEACATPRPLVLPLIPYGVSYHHEDYPGTLSVSPETLAQLVYDVGMGAARHGIAKLIIINGHGGNVPTLKFAAQKINRDAHIFTCVESGETSDTDVEGLADTDNDVHAGEIETSTALATRPHLVRMDRAARFVPRFSNEYLDFSSHRSVDWFARTSRISTTGVLGDPLKASQEKGERIWAVMIEHLVAFVESIKRMSLEEIHERRL